MIHSNNARQGVHFDTNKCHFKDEKGHEYDLRYAKNIAGHDYTKEIPVSEEIKFVYRANVCHDTIAPCTTTATGAKGPQPAVHLQAQGGATETLHIPAGETCRVLGRSHDATIESLSVAFTDSNPSGHALNIHYYGGDPCGGQTSHRSATLHLICNTKLDVSGVMTGVQRESCNTVFSIETPYACPNNGGGLGFFGWLVLIIVAAGVYVAVGCYLNYTNHELRGWEMMPHREFWTFVFEKLKEFWFFSFEQCKSVYVHYFAPEETQKRYGKEFVTKKAGMAGDGKSYGTTETL